MKPGRDRRHFKVVILGGGIGGCAAAHRLLHGGMDGSQIAIVEQLPELGGIARSEEVAVYPQNTDMSALLPFDQDDSRKEKRGLPVEYSWRVLGADYVVVPSILADIPDEVDCKEEEPINMSGLFKRFPLKASTRKNWARIWDTWTFGINRRCGEGRDAPRSMRETIGKTSDVPAFAKFFWHCLTLSEKVHLLERAIYGVTCSRARRDVELGSVAWRDYLAPVPPAAEPFLVRSIAPLMGIDMNRCTASSVVEYAEGWTRSGNDTRVSTKPTSDAWFRPWRRHLEAHGVTILTNCRAIGIEVAPGRDSSDCCGGSGLITAVDCEMIHGYYNPLVQKYAGAEEAKRFSLSGSWFVCGLPALETAKLLQSHHCRGPARSLGGLGGSHCNKIAACARRLTLLGDKQLQEIVGAQLFWKHPIAMRAPLCGLFLIDSPWQILLLPQGAFWAQSRDPRKWAQHFAQLYGSDNQKEAATGNRTVYQDVWSLTLCDSERPGGAASRFQRWTLCTREEVCNEIWAQLAESALLRDTCHQIVNLSSGLDELSNVLVELSGGLVELSGGQSIPWSNVAKPRIELWHTYQFNKDSNAERAGVASAERCGRQHQLHMAPASSTNGIKTADYLELHNVRESKLTSWEPKSSPNVGSRFIRPAHVRDGAPWRNLVWSGVWVAGPTEMHRMETAASNGFAAAELIFRTERKDGTLPKFHGAGSSARVMAHRSPSPRAFPWLLAPIRALDHICFVIGLPHPLNIAKYTFCALFILVLLLLFVWTLFN